MASGEWPEYPPHAGGVVSKTAQTFSISLRRKGGGRRETPRNKQTAQTNQPQTATKRPKINSRGSRESRKARPRLRGRAAPAVRSVPR